MYKENEDLKVARERLQSKDLTPEGRDFLVHILNITGRGMRCAYFGRFRDADGIEPVPGEQNRIARCLADETNGRTDVACPFYNENLEEKCSYKSNK